VVLPFDEGHVFNCLYETKRLKYVAGLIPQSLQLQVQVTGNLEWSYKSWECAKLCAHRSVCFCSQSGGGANIHLLT